jgi:hypothetical protein
MVNHFASLLSNLDLYSLEQTATSYLLVSDAECDIVTDDAYFINLAREYERSAEMVRLISPIVNRNFTHITLPSDLQRFYNLIFPESASNYYKQFLLFCYLKLIESTDRRNDIKKYDNRISYDLELIHDYFKFNRVYLGANNPVDYKLLIFGKLRSSASADYYSNKFLISQTPESASVYVYSHTQNKYYKPGVQPSSLLTNMAISLDTGGSYMTKAVAIGDTGVSFSLSGSFENFISSSVRTWEFTAEAPFRFDFYAKIEELASRQYLVERMLDYKRDQCTSTYENIWNMHHNSVYRLAGLLLAYVERVNLTYVS